MADMFLVPISKEQYADLMSTLSPPDREVDTELLFPNFCLYTDTGRKIVFGVTAVQTLDSYRVEGF